MKREVQYSEQLSKKMREHYPRLYKGEIGPKLLDSKNHFR